MFAKLLLVIIVAGATGGALLVNRQHLIDTAHDIARSHQRLGEQEQVLWRLRTEIAEHVTPEDVRRHMDRLGGSWVAMPDGAADDAARAARLAGSEPAQPIAPADANLGG